MQGNKEEEKQEEFAFVEDYIKVEFDTEYFKDCLQISNSSPAELQAESSSESPKTSEHENAELKAEHSVTEEENLEEKEALQIEEEFKETEHSLNLWILRTQFKEALDEMALKIETSKKRIRRLDYKVRVYKNKARRFEDQHNRTLSNFLELEEHYEAECNETIFLKRLVLLLESKTSEAEEQVAQMLEKLSQQTEKSDEAEKQLAEMSEKLSQETQKSKEAEKQVAEMFEKLSQQTQKCKEAEKNAAEMFEKLSQQTHKSKEAEKSAAEMFEKLSQRTQKSSNVKEDEDKMNKLALELAETKHEVQVLTELLASERSEVEESRKELNVLEMRIRDFEAEKNEQYCLRSQLDALYTWSDACYAREMNMKESYQILSDEKGILEDASYRLGQRLFEAEIQLETVTNELKVAEENLIDTEIELHEAEYRESLMMEILMDSEVKQEVQKSEVESLLEKIKVLEGQAVFMKEEFEASLSKVACLEKEIDDLRNGKMISYEPFWENELGELRITKSQESLLDEALSRQMEKELEAEHVSEKLIALQGQLKSYVEQAQLSEGEDSEIQKMKHHETVNDELLNKLQEQGKEIEELIQENSRLDQEMGRYKTKICYLKENLSAALDKKDEAVEDMLSLKDYMDQLASKHSVEEKSLKSSLGVDLKNSLEAKPSAEAIRVSPGMNFMFILVMVFVSMTFGMVIGQRSSPS